MKKLLLLIYFFSPVLLWAQQCGFDQIHQDLMRTDSVYRKKIVELDKGWSKQHDPRISSLSANTGTGVEYVIPVVVHVIHTGGLVGTIYNPSDSTIKGAIDDLNEVFASSYSGCPAPGSGGVKFPVRFELAKRSPTCGSTSGIIRINGGGLTGYNTNGVFGLSVGVPTESITALSRWNNESYINIWIVNKIDGKDGTSGTYIAGMGTFPDYEPKEDGLFFLASRFARSTISLAHEMGHVFGLYHTFLGSEQVGSTNNYTCPPNSNCNTEGDLVCDTQPEKESYNMCNVGLTNPCTGTTFNDGTAKNIMGYSSCKERFTAGQRDRFVYTLINERPGLISSMGCVPPDINVTTSSCAVTGIFAGSDATGGGPIFFKLGDLKVQSFGYMGYDHYRDNSCQQVARLVQGRTYTLELATYLNAQTKSIFIDYDDNGAFSSTERVAIFGIGSPYGNMTDTVRQSLAITIPKTGVVLNRPLRMRVVADEVIGNKNSAVVNTGCGMLYRGQAEDYAVYIRPDTTLVSAGGTGVADKLCDTGSTENWYKFINTNNSAIKVALSNLPANYDLYLYNSNKVEIGKSINTGNTQEGITTATVGAGTYYIKVKSVNGAYSCTQNYNLKVENGCTDASEPNNSFSTAKLLQQPSSQVASIQGTIHNSTDEDFYKLVILPNGLLKIDLTNLPKDFDLALYNSSNTLLMTSTQSATASETITYNAYPGTYYIKVYGYMGANNCQSYTLSTQLMPCTDASEPNNSLSTAKLLQQPSSQIASYQGTIHYVGDVDHYKIVIPVAGQIILKLTNLPADFDLLLSNSTGEELTGSTQGGTTSETITYNAPPGTYDVLVFGYKGANSCESYTLSTQLLSTSCAYAYGSNSNDRSPYDLGYAYPYPFPFALTGMIHSPGIVNYYSIMVQHSSYLKIYLQNLPADYDLKLYSESNTNSSSLLVQSTKTGTGNEFISYYASPGTYYFTVSGYKNAFSCLPYVLKVNTSSNSSPKFANGGEGDDTEEDANVKVTLSGQPEGAMLVYPNPSSNTIQFDYYSGESADAMVSIIDVLGRSSLQKQVVLVRGKGTYAADVSTLPPGMYTIQLQTGTDRRTGKFLIQR